jgi:triosephosphate isomerase
MTATRIPVIAGNWKMHLLAEPAEALARGVALGASAIHGVELIVCPVFTSLHAARPALQGSAVALGAQNCYHEESGAFTGEISPQMLLDAGCQWVIIGHSERRAIFGEDDALLNRKLHYALNSGLKVMFCIGETLAERESGAMNAVLERQVRDGLAGLSEAQFASLVLAYEPVWAIGTGVTATPEQAEEAHRFVRGLVAAQFGESLARGLRIQYGGSVKPENAAELIAKPNVDGFLVGGASLKADSFLAIATAAAGAQVS